MGALDIPRDVLFVGKGPSAVCYYRCLLPAEALGCDWAGVSGDPPDLHWQTGLVRDEHGVRRSMMPDMFNYKIVVLQQPATANWRSVIASLQEKGVKVVYEIDDYVHSIGNMEDHDFRKNFDKKYLWECEQTMKKCDALIASTEWIRGNYSHFCKRTFLCRNGIDESRYDLTIPERESVNVGWSGATGHLNAVTPWFQQTAQVMRHRANVNFISIGQPFASGFQEHFPWERALSIPFAAIEQYPAAMTMFDIALAPGGTGGWWRGKSDLRWLEAGALGIPAIVNPVVYPEVEDKINGLVARNPGEVLENLLILVDNPDVRATIGQSAREYVRRERNMKVMAQQWADAFDALVN